MKVSGKLGRNDFRKIDQFIKDWEGCKKVRYGEYVILVHRRVKDHEIDDYIRHGKRVVDLSRTDGFNIVGYEYERQLPSK